MNPNGPMQGPGSYGPPGAWQFVHHDAWWSGPLHLLPVLLLAVLIGVVVWGVLRTSAQRPTAAVAVSGPPPPLFDPAQEELRVRYARSDIDRAEYLQRRADLDGIAPPPDTGGSDPGTEPMPDGQE